MQLFDEYQEKCAEFVLPSATKEERVFGLWEEAGEVGGVFKRMFRGDYTPEEAGAKLFKELGDCLWYIGQIARDNEWKLSEIAQANVDKLASRKLRNVLVGTGDNR